MYSGQCIAIEAVKEHRSKRCKDTDTRHSKYTNGKRSKDEDSRKPCTRVKPKHHRRQIKRPEDIPKKLTTEARSERHNSTRHTRHVEDAKTLIAVETQKRPEEPSAQPMPTQAKRYETKEA